MDPNQFPSTPNQNQPYPEINPPTPQEYGAAPLEQTQQPPNSPNYEATGYPAPYQPELAQQNAANTAPLNENDRWTNPHMPEFMQAPDSNSQQATSNPYLPPPPGPYAPGDVNNPYAEQVPSTAAPTPQTANQYASQAATQKKRQAKVFIIAAVIFSLLTIAVLAVLAVAFVNRDDETNNSTTTDTQLQQDLNTLGRAVLSYNQAVGPLNLTPEEVGVLRVNHLDEILTDPRTNSPYTLTTAIPTEGEIQYVLGAVCRSDDSISPSQNEEDFAVRTLLEDGTLYCLQKNEIDQQ